MDLSIDVEDRGRWKLVSVSGEVDLYTSPQLRERLLGEADGSPRSIALDFSRVGFVDSSGLGVIVGLLKHTREQGGDLVVISDPDSPLAKLLRLTGLDSAIRRLDSADELAG
jgi:anti-sigma B factor antagonist